MKVRFNVTWQEEPLEGEVIDRSLVRRRRHGKWATGKTEAIRVKVDGWANPFSLRADSDDWEEAAR